MPRLSILSQFWSEIQDPVHPSDQLTLTAHATRGIFNLQFPPAAFIGDLDNAPIVVLMANGGYDPSMTPLEFSNPADIDFHYMHLRRPGPVDPARISPYYARNSFLAPLIREGKAVLVNACAYRSVQQTAGVEALANELTSVHFARKWLRRELIPQAIAGSRLVVAHRWKLWGLTEGVLPQGVVRSTAPASPYLTAANQFAVNQFLNRIRA